MSKLRTNLFDSITPAYLRKIRTEIIKVGERCEAVDGPPSDWVDAGLFKKNAKICFVLCFADGVNSIHGKVKTLAIKTTFANYPLSFRKSVKSITEIASLDERCILDKSLRRERDD
ncbi:hypothetical protein ADUPG1_009070 [Aduncisulcus paluster]|uniref:LAGLIDADG homing endonuclease n=1 Tax=Aduncisulcus paluster TaxID=2918883 RepID=A0ABQ5KU95_9EUKA|nr:hypothetical protein ADUPG1_009070 [Aduncisulcus paluster]